MKLLQELLKLADDTVMEHGFVELERCLGDMRRIVAEHALTEGFTDNHRGDLEKKFDGIENKLITARRMLAKVNASHFPPEEQNAHKSKIMRYINAFRKQLYDVMIELGMNEKEMNYHLDRIGLDREFGKPNEVFNVNRDPEKQSFKDTVNKQRNVAPPEEMGDFVKPKSNSGPNHRKWYQRIFGK